MYDYPESKDDFNHLFNILKSSQNFQKQQLNFDKNIHCIIIKSVSNSEQKMEDIDLLDEEFFFLKKNIEFKINIKIWILGKHFSLMKSQIVFY